VRVAGNVFELGREYVSRWMEFQPGAQLQSPKLMARTSVRKRLGC
jgi:hypothetical protein